LLAQNPIELGGFNKGGEPVIVKTDESKFFNRKYNRGRDTEGHWVFGMIEREDPRNASRLWYELNKFIEIS